MKRRWTILGVWVLILAGGTCAWAQSELPRSPTEKPAPPKLDRPRGKAMKMPTLDEAKKGAMALPQGRSATKKTKPIKVSIPTAGLELQLPPNFAILPNADETQVLSAAHTEGRQASQSLSILAYPVESTVSAKKFSEAMLEDMKASLAMRHIKNVEAKPMKIAGSEGYFRSANYSFRGVATLGYNVVFMRDYHPAIPGMESLPLADRPVVRIAYVLTAEVKADNQPALVTLFTQVTNTIKLVKLLRPIEVKTIYAGDYVKNFQVGCAIRHPYHWFARTNDMGILLGQTDYTLGGVSSPNAQLLSLLVPAKMTAKDCGALSIKDDQSKPGLQVEILKEGPAKLGRAMGYQYVLRKRIVPVAPVAPKAPKLTEPLVKPAPPESASPAVIEVRRLLCVPAKGAPGKARHYALLVVFEECTPQAAEAITDQLAATFSPLRILKDKPIAKPYTGPVKLKGLIP